VPFGALPWSDGLLVDAVASFSAPSWEALDAVLQRPAAGAPTSALTVGDPRADLPGARAEVNAVAATFRSSKVLVGANATETAVRRAITRSQLSHFAVHGIRSSPNRPAYLALLEDSTHDGRLRADEIAALSIPGSLVVLSVCDSARGVPNKGDELVGVVDRAFLAAGARSVIASRWPVHDAASVLFMRRFYAELPTRGVLGAFHVAQRALRNGQVKPGDLGPTLLAQLTSSRVQAFRGVQAKTRPMDLKHPYFWAAFTLRGDYR
jgi:CHAT domain-containing protein